MHKKINALAFAIGLVFLVVILKYHLGLILEKNQLEFRETAIVYITHLIKNGTNPFSANALPVGFNAYGIFYHIVALPFTYIIDNDFIAHRIVSAIFIALSAVFLFLLIKKQGVPFGLNLISVVFFYALQLFFVNALARPDSLGVALMLGVFYYTLSQNYSNRSMTVGLILSILAFYTKVYFFTVFLVILFYVFVFVSKRKAIIFSFLFICSLIISVIIINHFFRYYFYETFFINQTIASNNLQHLNRQFDEFWNIHYGLFVAGIMALGIFLHNSKWGNILEQIRKLKEYISIDNLKRPLLNTSFSIIPVCLLGYYLLVYYKMAGHVGAYMNYLFQLITPFLVLSIFYFFKQLKINFLILLPLMCICFNSGYNFISEKNNKNIKDDRELLIKYIEDKNNVLNSPAIASFLYKRNMKIFDTGMTEYFKFGQKETKLSQFLLGYSSEISKIHKRYQNELIKMLVNKEFDLIAVNIKSSKLLSINSISKHYSAIDTLTIKFNHTGQSWDIAIYQPKEKVILSNED